MIQADHRHACDAKMNRDERVQISLRSAQMSMRTLTNGLQLKVTLGAVHTQKNWKIGQKKNLRQTFPEYLTVKKIVEESFEASCEI
jgi:hypothetical protein